MAVAYFLLICYFTIFAESLGRAPGDIIKEPRYNLVPFAEIKRFIIYRRQLGLRAFMLNVVGNVAAFIPCGLFLPVISIRCRKMAGCVLFGFLISFIIECTQLAFRAGSFDIDDMMLNTLGVFTGFVIGLFVRHISEKRRKKIRPRKVEIRKID